MQAYAIAGFMMGFVALAAAVLARGNILLFIVAAVLVGASVMLFRKAKSLESNG